MIDWQDLVARELHDKNDSSSHTEYDPYLFHPSQIGKCKRQCVKSKYGLEDHGVNTLWNFHLGHERHEWIQDLASGIPGLEFEKEVETHHDEITFTGHADVYDPMDNVVYDFKTRKSWNYFDPPTDRHVDQLTVYMDALDADYGQVVYILKSGPADESEPIIRTWPDGEFYEYDPDRFRMLADKAWNIADQMAEFGVPETVEDIPFEPCGCWLCNMEE